MVVMKTKPLSNDNEMKQVPLFSGLSKTEIDSLKKLMTAVNIHSGKTVVREGDVGREFMIILSGTASVSREGSKFATLGPGDFFGTRQSGVPNLRVADLIRDYEIMEQARIESTAWFRTVNLDHNLVKNIRKAWPERFGLVKIG